MASQQADASGGKRAQKELEDVSNIQVINGAKGCTRDIMVSCLLCLWSSELLYLVKNGYVLFCF